MSEERQITYDELVQLTDHLSYQDKLRLAQRLMQLAKEDEQNPERDEFAASFNATSPETIQYVVERIKKLKPTKKKALLNVIGTMFHSQGVISDLDKEKIVVELQQQRYITIEENDRVSYRK